MEKEFTKPAQQVLSKAKSLAKRLHHPYIGTEHLLLALRQEFTGVAGQVLAMNHVEEKQMLSITLSDAGWQDKLESMVRIALEAGGPDNITAMYVTFEEEHE